MPETDAPLLSTTVDEAFVAAARRHIVRAGMRLFGVLLAMMTACLFAWTALRDERSEPGTWVAAVVVTVVVVVPLLFLLRGLHRRQAAALTDRLFPVGSRAAVQLRPDGLWVELHGGGSLLRYHEITATKVVGDVVEIRTARLRVMMLVPASLVTEGVLAEIRERTAAASAQGLPSR